MADGPLLVFLDSTRTLWEIHNVPVPRSGESVLFPSGRMWRVTAVHHVYTDDHLQRIEVFCQLRDD